MTKSKKELMDKIKEKSPELYDELVTEESEVQDFRGYGHYGRGRGRGCGGGFGDGNGNGRGGGRWGGQRCGAGRPKMFCDRKTITKQVAESTVTKIKDFAQKNDISENEALDKLINAGYESLNNNL